VRYKCENTKQHQRRKRQHVICRKILYREIVRKGVKHLTWQKYVNEQNTMRISTGMLNDILADATARVQPPTDKGKRLKIYYMTQASTKPPTFVCFCNKAELFHFSYQRYLENQIRSTFGLEGTPVRFVIRERGEK
jgi:GTP-binding protein